MRGVNLRVIHPGFDSLSRGLVPYLRVRLVADAALLSVRGVALRAVITVVRRHHVGSHLAPVERVRVLVVHFVGVQGRKWRCAVRLRTVTVTLYRPVRRLLVANCWFVTAASVWCGRPLLVSGKLITLLIIKSNLQ